MLSLTFRLAKSPERHMIISYDVHAGEKPTSPCNLLGMQEGAIGRFRIHITMS